MVLSNIVNKQHTIGTAITIMTIHVRARQLVKSETTPAKTPPSDNTHKESVNNNSLYYM